MDCIPNAEIPEHVLKAQERMLNKHKRLSTDEGDRWAKELDMLTTRVKLDIVELDLGNGDIIAVRGALSEQEMQHIQKLTKNRDAVASGKKSSDLDETQLNEMNMISYEILEIVTANPTLTKEWFQENPDKFSTEDMLKVVFNYFDRMTERAKRAETITSFR